MLPAPSAFSQISGNKVNKSLRDAIYHKSFTKMYNLRKIVCNQNKITRKWTYSFIYLSKKPSKKVLNGPVTK